MSFLRSKIDKTQTVLKYISGMECFLCGQWPSKPFHITAREHGNDHGDNLIPLCDQHSIEWQMKPLINMVDKYPPILDWLCDHDRWELAHAIFKIKDKRKKIHVTLKRNEATKRRRHTVRSNHLPGDRSQIK